MIKSFKQTVVLLSILAILSGFKCKVYAAEYYPAFALRDEAQTQPSHELRHTIEIINHYIHYLTEEDAQNLCTFYAPKVYLQSKLLPSMDQRQVIIKKSTIIGFLLHKIRLLISYAKLQSIHRLDFAQHIRDTEQFEICHELRLSTLGSEALYIIMDNLYGIKTEEAKTFLIANAKYAKLNFFSLITPNPLKHSYETDINFSTIRLNGEFSNKFFFTDLPVTPQSNADFLDEILYFISLIHVINAGYKTPILWAIARATNRFHELCLMHLIPMFSEEGETLATQLLQIELRNCLLP